ncbi:MAG: caspase family protein [Methylococcales bacterium]
MRIKLLVLVLAWVVVSTGLQAKTILVDGGDRGSTREEAEQRLLKQAVLDGLKPLMRTAHVNKNIAPAVDELIQQLANDHYKPLVVRLALDIDTQQDDEYFLEGSVTLDYDYLQQWLNDWMQANKKARFSFYITPDTSLALTAEDLALGKDFMRALEQQLSDTGFEIKNSNQQKQAQYRLKLSKLEKEQGGLNGTVIFAVEVLDNRADGDLLTTAQESAAASIASLGTPGALKIELLKRAAEKVSSQVIRAISSQQNHTEIVFYLPGEGSKRNQQRSLEDGLLALCHIDSSDEAVDGFVDKLNPQVTRTSEGKHSTFSFELPNTCQASKRELQSGLQSLLTKIAQSKEPALEVSKAGRKWVVFNELNRPQELERGAIADFQTLAVEQLIREGKLDTPPGSGHNAFDTVRARLSEHPDDPNAKVLLQNISEVFLRNADIALEKNQLRQARRYADRAKTIWPQNPNVERLLAKIRNTPIIIPSAPPNLTPPPVTVQANPERGKQILSTGKYWALLIANQNYTQGVSSLQTPLADIRSLKNILETVYGFEQVVTVEDGTKDTIVKAMYSLQTKIGKDDSLLIFYAGHGEQEKGFGGKGFWIPADGMPPYAESKEYLSTWVPNSLVHDIIQASKAKHVLMVSDSCFSGTFKMSTRGLGRQKELPTNSSDSSLSSELYSLASLSSRKAISSGDLEPVADGGGDGHSVFAYHLLKVLNEKKPITAERLFQKMRNPIVQAASQQPQYFIIDSKTDEGGDFIFVPR